MAATEPHGLHVVRHDGAEPPLIVVHGAMDRSISFGRMVRSLASRAVVRYDRRGYARSRDVGTGDLGDHVSDLLDLMAGRPAVLLGHSVGGVISLVAAAQPRTSVLGVLAYEAPMPWLDWWPREREGSADGPRSDPADEAEAFMRRMIGDRMWARLPASTREARREEGEALRADIASVSGPLAPFDPALISVPILSVAGSETTWYHRRAAEELAADAADGELAVLQGATHGGHLTHPADLAGIVRRFVEGLT